MSDKWKFNWIKKKAGSCNADESYERYKISQWLSNTDEYLTLRKKEKMEKRGVCLVEGWLSHHETHRWFIRKHYVCARFYLLITLIISSMNSPRRTYSIHFSLYRAALKAKEEIWGPKKMASRNNSQANSFWTFLPRRKDVAKPRFETNSIGE